MLIQDRVSPKIFYTSTYKSISFIHKDFWVIQYNWIDICWSSWTSPVLTEVQLFWEIKWPRVAALPVFSSLLSLETILMPYKYGGSASPTEACKVFYQLTCLKRLDKRNLLKETVQLTESQWLKLCKVFPVKLR